MSEGVKRIAAERSRQIESEGWDKDHDKDHEAGELVRAGVWYAIKAIAQNWIDVSGPDNESSISYKLFRSSVYGWPWDYHWWKPSSQIRNLEKAGALIAAEIDRLLEEGDK